VSYEEYLKEDYEDLVKAANKITGNAPYALDLLHYAIVEFSYKKVLQEVIDAGAARFYLVRIMMTQHRSSTGPFHRNYRKQALPIIGDVEDEIEENEDVTQINKLIETLPWYDKTLFRLYCEGGHNFTSLSNLTMIPRTSISLTINRIREYVKNNLKQ